MIIELLGLAFTLVKKLESNNVCKDRSIQRYLVLDILTNPDRVTLTKKGKFWGKIHCQFRCLHTTL